MTIQYPDKLSKDRPIYFAMDHTSSQDTTICNLIVNKLKAAGFNVVRYKVGPNEMYQNMVYVYNQNLTNAILFHLFNGVDPSNIREVAVNGNDNRGRTVRARGNDVVLAWFYDACDFTRTSGTCYSSVRASETGSRLDNPLQYCQNNKIYTINNSSNNHTGNYDDIKDYTGEKVVQSFINLFETSSSNNNPNTSNPEEEISIETDTTKTISTRTITKVYTVAYYNKVLRSKTNDLGIFFATPQLPYKGLYQVTISFGGDKIHNSVTRTIKIKNYSNKSSIFSEELVQTDIVTTYTDGTVTNQTVGTIPKNAHIKKIISTEKYDSNGNKTEVSTNTVYMDDILVEKINEDNIISGEINEVTDNDVVITTPTVINRANPFNQDIALAAGVPNVVNMQTGEKKYKMVDTSTTYTLSESQYRDVMRRDSKTMQLESYKVSKYTAFESTDTETYNVLKREQWNSIEESIYYYLVQKNTTSWPSNIVVDFQNKRTSINGSWINWKNTSTGECYYPIVADKQNWGYTCGPTSASVCSQVLHNYFTERSMQNSIGATSGSGSGPAQIAKALNNKNFIAYNVTSNQRSYAVSELEAGRPWIWHIKNHYYCLAVINNNKILVCNSSGSHGAVTGWHSISDAAKNSYGGHVRVGLNWSISESEKQQLHHFFNSMGGAFTVPVSTESIRRI